MRGGALVPSALLRSLVSPRDRARFPWRPFETAQCAEGQERKMVHSTEHPRHRWDGVAELRTSRLLRFGASREDDDHVEQSRCLCSEYVHKCRYVWLRGTSASAFAYLRGATADKHDHHSLCLSFGGGRNGRGGGCLRGHRAPETVCFCVTLRKH